MSDMDKVQEDKVDYGATLNLPQTEFPMRGNLPKREPLFLEKWNEADIYKLVAEKNAGKPKFILHDGPPYANGNIHLGHVLNKVLKDMVIKYKTMSGFDSPYTPGWDTHGLPIERRAIQELGLNKNQEDKVAFREKCKEFALSFVDIQREQFKRIGVRADWDNPYLTLLPKFEAAQIRVFGEMANKGYIYKGKKPVYWCADCETALAEAEVEYADHKAPTIHVKFKVIDGKGIIPEDAYFVIWTTTPWTIPANLAICLNAAFDYVVADFEGEKLIVAKELLNSFAETIGKECNGILQEFKGADAEFVRCKHPLYDRDSLVILGDHVTLDAGTGCVHTAPGHGVEDYEVGIKYGLDIYSPVDAQGRMTADTGEFAGMDLETCNKAMITALNNVGALLSVKTISHSYPHCWRCKHPIVFRGTEQWFCSIDGFREKALEEIDNTKWIPSWGHDRIYNMVRDRSDWCISRQRTWGVPIPVVYCEECGKEIITPETIDIIANIFEKEGSLAWYKRPAEDFLPKDFVCPHCGHNHFRKESDIMDVWFDSGSTSFGVLEGFEGLRAPADLYLEGSDQHRGWFNSSLNLSVAVRGKAPYKQVLTHGFLVDEQGRKLSKSLGNFIDPQKVIDQMGADVLRLWVASADYRNDLANSPAIMKQVSETYRKIRNTARYLLSNLYDFDPNTDMLPYAELREIDKMMLGRLNELVEKAHEGYENYEFHTVYHSVRKFCVVDLSNLYLDIVKDRLYAEKADSNIRRSCQTAMYHILNALVRIITPILAFTSEEIYQYMPKTKDMPEFVQLLDMPEVVEEWNDSEIASRWERFFELREDVSKALEVAREEKVIGHSLDAKVVLCPTKEDLELLNSLGEELARLFIVSQTEVIADNDFVPTEEAKIGVKVTKAEGEKCERCWIYSTEVGKNPEHSCLCPRCAEVLSK